MKDKKKKRDSSEEKRRKKKRKERKEKHKKKEEERRNPITGKKLKLKIHKTSVDKKQDENRTQLLKFLNSAF